MINALRTILKRTLIIISALVMQLPVSSFAIASDISQRELMQRLDINDVPLIIDVRKPDEFTSGHVPGARNIPHSDMVTRLDELRGHEHEEVVVYCESGRRAAIAQKILEQSGFTKVRHLEGDMKSWRKIGLPQVE
jgi:phage shock protein E